MLYLGQQRAGPTGYFIMEGVCHVDSKTRHHLVWERRCWAHSVLRHNRFATVQLPKKIHERLHEELPPFEPLTGWTAKRFEKLALQEFIGNRRDVLKLMITISHKLLDGRRLPRRDVIALRDNIRYAHQEIEWLDQHYPCWNRQAVKSTRRSEVAETMTGPQGC